MAKREHRYYRGLTDDEKKMAKKSEKIGKALDDNDPSKYQEWPSDKAFLERGGKTQQSEYTKAFHEKYGARKNAKEDAPDYRPFDVRPFWNNEFQNFADCGNCKWWDAYGDGFGHCNAFDFSCKEDKVCDGHQDIVHAINNGKWITGIGPAEVSELIDSKIEPAKKKKKKPLSLFSIIANPKVRRAAGPKPAWWTKFNWTQDWEGNVFWQPENEDDSELQSISLKKGGYDIYSDDYSDKVLIITFFGGHGGMLSIRINPDSSLTHDFAEKGVATWKEDDRFKQELQPIVDDLSYEDFDAIKAELKTFANDDDDWMMVRNPSKEDFNKMTPQEIHEKATPGWKILKSSNWSDQEGTGHYFMERKYELDNFEKVEEFVEMINDAIIELDHHPEIAYEYNMVIVRTWSHDIKSLDERDYTLAETVDMIYKNFPKKQTANPYRSTVKESKTSQGNTDYQGEKHQDNPKVRRKADTVKRWWEDTEWRKYDNSWESFSMGGKMPTVGYDTGINLVAAGKGSSSPVVWAEITHNIGEPSEKTGFRDIVQRRYTLRPEKDMIASGHYEATPAGVWRAADIKDRNTPVNIGRKSSYSDDWEYGYEWHAAGKHGIGGYTFDELNNTTLRLLNELTYGDILSIWENQAIEKNPKVRRKAASNADWQQEASWRKLGSGYHYKRIFAKMPTVGFNTGLDLTIHYGKDGKKLQATVRHSLENENGEAAMERKYYLHAMNDYYAAKHGNSNPPNVWISQSLESRGRPVLVATAGEDDWTPAWKFDGDGLAGFTFEEIDSQVMRLLADLSYDDAMEIWENQAMWDKERKAKLRIETNPKVRRKAEVREDWVSAMTKAIRDDITGDEQGKEFILLPPFLGAGSVSFMLRLYSDANLVIAFKPEVETSWVISGPDLISNQNREEIAFELDGKIVINRESGKYEIAGRHSLTAQKFDKGMREVFARLNIPELKMNPKKDDKKKFVAEVSKKTGIKKAILAKVYDKGIAAWGSGHRPGTNPVQWAKARVYAFTEKGGPVFNKKGGKGPDHSLAVEAGLVKAEKNPSQGLKEAIHDSIDSLINEIDNGNYERIWSAYDIYKDDLIAPLPFRHAYPRYGRTDKYAGKVELDRIKQEHIEEAKQTLLNLKKSYPAHIDAINTTEENGTIVIYRGRLKIKEIHIEYIDEFAHLSGTTEAYNFDPRTDKYLEWQQKNDPYGEIGNLISSKIGKISIASLHEDEVAGPERSWTLNKQIADGISYIFWNGWLDRNFDYNEYVETISERIELSRIDWALTALMHYAKEDEVFWSTLEKNPKVRRASAPSGPELPNWFPGGDKVKPLGFWWKKGQGEKHLLWAQFLFDTPDPHKTMQIGINETMNNDLYDADVYLNRTNYNFDEIDVRKSWQGRKNVNWTKRDIEYIKKNSHADMKDFNPRGKTWQGFEDYLSAEEIKALIEYAYAQVENPDNSGFIWIPKTTNNPKVRRRTESGTINEEIEWKIVELKQGRRQNYDAYRTFAMGTLLPASWNGIDFEIAVGAGDYVRYITQKTKKEVIKPQKYARLYASVPSKDFVKIDKAVKNYNDAQAFCDIVLETLNTHGLFEGYTLSPGYDRDKRWADGFSIKDKTASFGGFGSQSAGKPATWRPGFLYNSGSVYPTAQDMKDLIQKVSGKISKGEMKALTRNPKVRRKSVTAIAIGDPWDWVPSKMRALVNDAISIEETEDDFSKYYGAINIDGKENNLWFEVTQPEYDNEIHDYVVSHLPNGIRKKQWIDLIGSKRESERWLAKVKRPGLFYNGRQLEEWRPLNEVDGREKITDVRMESPKRNPKVRRKSADVSDSQWDWLPPALKQIFDRSNDKEFTYDSKIDMVWFDKEGLNIVARNFKEEYGRYGEHSIELAQGGKMSLAKWKPILGDDFSKYWTLRRNWKNLRPRTPYWDLVDLGGGTQITTMTMKPNIATKGH